MKKIILMCLFGFILPFKQVVEFYSNDMPKVLKVYSDQNEIKLIKEIGYHSDGARHYQIIYNNGEISNIQRWDKEGQKINLKSSENNFLELWKSDALKEKKNQIEEKKNQIENIIKRQDNKILYMNYKNDSLKIELSKHQIAFDEYKRKTQREIAILVSDLKSETSQRKADDRRTNKIITEEIDKLAKDLSDAKEKIELSYEQEIYQEDFDSAASIEKKKNTKDQAPPGFQFIPYDRPPKPKRGMGIKAIYPRLAKDAGIEGKVIVEFFIDTDGNVLEAYVIKGVPNTGLDEAALAAIKKSKWEPALQRDKKVGVWTRQTINFILE